ncbi:hypothetical protein [Microbacterium sp. KR10-403]|uniref:hypothetical protein n=1 Tax=Microbacterium sp. KR10-403 TaxID=3158581 RepID=UPI0032E4A07E
MRGRRAAQTTVRRLLDAWRAGDAAAVAAVLHPRVTLTIDAAAPGDAPAGGAPAVAAALLGLSHGIEPEGFSLVEATGMPGILLRTTGSVRGVVVVEAHRARVARLWAIVAPAKLTTWT